ncbi:MAG: hypothetical protein WCS70_16750, partial [Verrucomicrobiota bacterium]
MKRFLSLAIALSVTLNALAISDTNRLSTGVTASTSNVTVGATVITSGTITLNGTAVLTNVPTSTGGLTTNQMLSVLTNNVPWISQVASGYIAFVEIPAAPYWSISNFTLVNTPMLSDRYPGLLSYRIYDGAAASNNPITEGLVAWRSTVWTNPAQVAQDGEWATGSRVNGHGGLFGVDGNYIFPHVMGYMGWTYQSNDVHNVDFWGWHQTNNATLGSNNNGYLEKVFSIRGGDRSVLFRNDVEIWSNLTVRGSITGTVSNSLNLGGVAASAFVTNGAGSINGTLLQNGMGAVTISSGIDSNAVNSIVGGTNATTLAAIALKLNSTYTNNTVTGTSNGVSVLN